MNKANKKSNSMTAGKSSTKSKRNSQRNKGSTVLLLFNFATKILKLVENIMLGLHNGYVRYNTFNKINIIHQSINHSEDNIGREPEMALMILKQVRANETVPP